MNTHLNLFVLRGYLFSKSIARAISAACSPVSACVSSASKHWITWDFPILWINVILSSKIAPSRLASRSDVTTIRKASVVSNLLFISIIYSSDTRTSAFDNYSSCRINCRWNCTLKSELRLWTRPFGSGVLLRFGRFIAAFIFKKICFPFLKLDPRVLFRLRGRRNCQLALGCSSL